MKKLFSKKIILSGLLALIIVSGISFKTNALTIADIEFLIGLGLIPSDKAENARNLLNPNAILSPGNIISTDENFSKECLVINTTLVRGVSGNLVTALQSFLKSEGHFPANQEVTRYFGDVTWRAVADFQVKNGLIQSSSQAGAGNVGPLTSAKIQEISCQKMLAEEQEEIKQELEAAQQQNTNSPNRTILSPREEKTPTLSVSNPEIYVNTDTGELKVKYEVKVQPVDEARSMEVLLICDPSAVRVNSTNIKECGEFVTIRPINNGRKSVTISYENKTRIIQPIVFSVEVFDINGNSMGTAEVRNEVSVAKPVIQLDINNTITSQYGTLPLQSRSCTRAEQLEFIRYTMSPYDPLNPVSLPVCWPGELMCNRTNPPTYCNITGGPSSDELCLLSQKFLNGKCVPK